MTDTGMNDYIRPRPLLLHFHNHEMLVAYGQGSRSPKSLREETERLTRYAVAVASGRLIILPKFLWESEYFGKYLQVIQPLTKAGLLAYGGTTSDFSDDLGQKQRQYRDAPGLFPSYFDERLSRQQLRTLDELTWVQRLGPSATASISDAWMHELQPGGELAEGILAAVDRGRRQRIEAALEAVPDRLEGRAFVLREVSSVVDFDLDGETKTRINWLINRTYLRLYLNGLDAVALFDTPLGGLDFGLAAEPETQRLFISHARLSTLLAQAGLRSAIENLRWSDLIILTHEAGFRILIDGLLGSAIGSDYTGPTKVELVLRRPDVAGKLLGAAQRIRNLHDAQEHVALLLELLGPEVVEPGSAVRALSRIVRPQGKWAKGRASTARRSGASPEVQLPFDDDPGIQRVGILTITADEFTALIRRLPDLESVHKKRWYSVCRVAQHESNDLEVVALAARAQGPVEAAVTCRDMIDDWRLDALCLVGIGGGLPTTDYTLGDVVLARSIQDLNVRALTEGKPEAYSATGSPIEPVIADLLAHLPGFASRLDGWESADSVGVERPPIGAYKTYGNDDWKASVDDAMRYHFIDGSRNHPIAVVAPVVSSSTLVKSTGFAGHVKEFARHAAVFEMEAAGVLRALEDARVPVLVAKGVSDIVGLERRPEWTDYAAAAASSFLVRLLESGVLSRSLR